MAKNFEIIDLPKLNDNVTVYVVLARNKRNTGRVFNLGMVSKIINNRVFFDKSIVVLKKEYYPQLFINNSYDDTLTVYLHPVIAAKQGSGHTYFDNVDLIK